MSVNQCHLVANTKGQLLLRKGYQSDPKTNGDQVRYFLK